MLFCKKSIVQKKVRFLFLASKAIWQRNLFNKLLRMKRVSVADRLRLGIIMEPPFLGFIDPWSICRYNGFSPTTN
jgi:hypothetical protein